jgi:hypothetical protein
MDQKPTLKPPIKLSNFTQALLHNFSLIQKKVQSHDLSKIVVSQTVSFFAIVYEKIRNAVEYREEHLIRRAAIERVLKRKLALNPQGKGEAENLLREMLWARYFPNGSLGTTEMDLTQKLIDQYVSIRNALLTGQTSEKKGYYSQFLFDLLTCEIEESLSMEEAKKNSLFTFYIYQVLRNKIKVEGLTDDQKDALFYVAVERGYAKNDLAYLRYHLFTLSYNSFTSLNPDELKSLIPKLSAMFERIDGFIKNPQVERLIRYARSQIPPFTILFEIIKRHPENVTAILANKDKLWTEVEQICREKYQQTGTRLRNVAIKSLIYIFLTKMLFVLILEYPLSLYFYNEVSFFSIGINTIFPPLLMLFIVGLVRVPGEDNTRRISERIIDIEDADKSFETSLAYILRKPRVRRPLLIFGFTVFYSLTFIITLALIYALLNVLYFNLISQLIFIFFVSVVSFFGFRVRQIAKEFQLRVSESFFSPFVDFFFMPILSLGKFFSTEIAKLNFFIVILDFLIEAPFKLIFEVVEEWISFVKARKEEII